MLGWKGTSSGLLGLMFHSLISAGLTKDVRTPQHPVWAWLQAGTLWETNLLKEGSAIHKIKKGEITDLPEETFPLCIFVCPGPIQYPRRPRRNPGSTLGPSGTSDFQLGSAVRFTSWALVNQWLISLRGCVAGQEPMNWSYLP